MSTLFERIAAAIGGAPLDAPAPVVEQFKVAPLPRADTAVVSVETSMFGAGAGGGQLRYNPDDLVKKKGLRIYKRMSIDEQVKAVCVFKRDTILSRGWTLEYEEDSPLSEDERKARVGLMRKIIERMPGSFIDALNAIARGREMGFSLTEKVFAPVQVDGKTWTGLAKMLARDPESFEFVTDEFGELVSCTQNAGGKRIDIDLDKFVFYVHNPEYDMYFGQSDLRSAYRSWYMKEQVLSFWGGFLERFGAGFIKAQVVGDQAPRPGTPAYVAMQNAMANARNGASMISPPGVETEIVFPSSTDAYEKAVTWHDLAIAKALLVPNLLGISHTGQTGAYSQAQVQLESFAGVLAADKQRLESCITEQLIRDLGERNWGDGEYPRFRFQPISAERTKWVIETWTKLVGINAVLTTEEDETRLREMLDMPPRPPEAQPLINPLEQQKLQLQADANAAQAEALRQRPPAAGSNPDAVRNSREEQLAREKKPDDAKPQADAAFIRAVERVNFAVIERRQDMLAGNLVSDLSSIVARAVNRVLGTEDQLRRLTDTDVADAAGLELSSVDKGKLRAACNRALSSSWLVGQQMSMEELRKSAPANMKRRRVTMTDIRENAAAYFDLNAFRMAGNLADAVRSVIQQELQLAIKYGRTPAETRIAIWARLVAKGFSERESVRAEETDEGVMAALDALWLDDEEQAAAYLDTLARTNLFEAMNEARYAEFTDPALDGFVVAFRYSAVLDDRTTKICAALHDRVYKAGNPVWDDVRPPNHYNCRSLLIPITQVDIDLKNDNWNGVESSPPPVEPQVGFGKGAKA